jgi:hypothetical protein
MGEQPENQGGDNQAAQIGAQGAESPNAMAGAGGVKGKEKGR